MSGFKKNFYQYQTEQTISLTSSLYSKQFSIWKCYLIFSLSHFFLSLSLSNIYTLLKISPISDSLDPHHYIWTQWTITTPIPHPQTLYTLSNSLHSTPPHLFPKLYPMSDSLPSTLPLILSFYLLPHIRPGPESCPDSPGWQWGLHHEETVLHTLLTVSVEQVRRLQQDLI